MAKANSAFHPSGIGKWVPASARKAKAGMVHSVSACTWCVQVKLWDPLRTRATPEHLRGVFTTRRYTNPRLPYLTLRVVVVVVCRACIISHLQAHCACPLCNLVLNDYQPHLHLRYDFLSVPMLIDWEAMAGEGVWEARSGQGMLWYVWLACWLYYYWLHLCTVTACFLQSSEDSSLQPQKNKQCQQ